jgi:ketosteroid isomerase-like protein
MTAEEIVMSGYAAFGSGDMDALGKLYHPQCKTTFHGDHALGGEYIGFPDLLTNMLAKLNDAWPGFSLGVDKVVADDKTFACFVPSRQMVG